jgi:RNA polymerase sigma-70 factor (ECF subfamily)
MVGVIRMPEARAITLPLELRALLVKLADAEVADDQQWILSLLRQHGLTVVTMLWRMLGSDQDVLDAYQTAVCQLTNKGPHAIQSNRGGYFYRIAVNAGIGILRQRRQQCKQWPTIVDTQMRRQNDHAPQTAEQCFDQREMLGRMRQAIYQLPPQLRDVIILRDLGELPYRDVASILGIRSTSARLYRRQAVVRLAELIGREI